MKNLEIKTRRIIKELKSIKLGKQQIPQLEETIETINWGIEELYDKSLKITEKLNKKENDLERKTSRNRREKQEEEIEMLQAEYLKLIKQINQEKRRVELYKFELKILYENTSRENGLVEKLRAILLEDKVKIESSDSLILKELLGRFIEIESVKTNKKMFKQIIELREKIREIIKKVQLKINHNLYREIRTMQYERGESDYKQPIRIRSEKTLDEVQQLSLQMGSYLKKLQEIREELNVNKNYKVVEEINEENALERIEKITSKLMDKKVGGTSKNLLRRISKSIEEMKRQYEEEINLTDKRLDELEAELIVKL